MRISWKVEIMCRVIRLASLLVMFFVLCLTSHTFYAKTLHAQEVSTDSWSGLSVSLGVGAGNFDPTLNADLSRQDFGCLAACFFNADNNLEGLANISDSDWKAFGTAQLAYDQKVGNFVVGIFADVDFGQDSSTSNVVSGTDEKNCRGLFVFPIICPVPPDGFVGIVETETGNSWSVGGRIGYLVSPTWLIYGLAAYSETNVELSASMKDPFAGGLAFAGGQPTNARFKTDISGVTFGGGTEFQIAKNLHIKFEYRYTDFDSKSLSFSKTEIVGNILNGQFTDESVNLNLDSEVHSVRAAIVLKLGNPL